VVPKGVAGAAGAAPEENGVAGAALEAKGEAGAVCAGAGAEPNGVAGAAAAGLAEAKGDAGAAEADDDEKGVAGAAEVCPKGTFPLLAAAGADEAKGEAAGAAAGAAVGTPLPNGVGAEPLSAPAARKGEALPVAGAAGTVDDDANGLVTAGAASV